MECEGWSKIVLNAHLTAPITAHCSKKTNKQTTTNKQTRKQPRGTLRIFRVSVAEQTTHVLKTKVRGAMRGRSHGDAIIELSHTNDIVCCVRHQTILFPETIAWLGRTSARWRRKNAPGRVFMAAMCGADPGATTSRKNFAFRIK
jgi:hypothetical protein